MASRPRAFWQSITLWTLSFGSAVTMGISTVAWGNDAPQPTSESASPSPPPAADTPTPPQPQPGDRRKERMQHMRQACAADVKTLCAQVKPGEGRILDCLEAHSKDLSDKYYDQLEKRAQPHKGDTQ